MFLIILLKKILALIFYSFFVRIIKTKINYLYLQDLSELIILNLNLVIAWH